MQKKNIIYLVAGGAAILYFYYMKKKKAEEAQPEQTASEATSPDQALAPAFVNKNKPVARRSKRKLISPAIDESASPSETEISVSEASSIFSPKMVKLSPRAAKLQVRQSGGTRKQARQAARSARKARKMGELDSVIF